MTDGELSALLEAADIAPAPATLTPQDVTRSALLLATLAAPGGTVAHPRTVLFSADDGEVQAMAWAGMALGSREIGGKPVWVRLHRADGSQGLLAVLHCFASPAEMELVLLGHKGMIGRTALRFLARWAFINVGAVGLQRVVIRLPVEAVGLQDYARRAGFRNEGTARSFFAPGFDASVWAMTRADCPWLPGTAPLAAASAFSTLSAERVH